MTNDKLRAASDDGPPFDAWSFVRDVLTRGGAIEIDSTRMCRSFEEHSAHLDAVASKFADLLKPHLKPTEANQ